MICTRPIVLTPGLLAGLLGAALAGCQAPAVPSGPTERVVRIEDYDAFLDQAATLLRELDLPPTRIDRVSGEIVLRPTTRGQWFEWWRPDSRGGYQTLESSLHTLRSRGRVAIRPSDPALAAYVLSVEVEKERFSSPERQVTTTSGALAIYSERLPTTEGLRASRLRDDHWVSLGRDGLLEAYLLERLAALPATDAPAADADAAGTSPEVGGAADGPIE
jgi:hypothetical protein